MRNPHAITTSATAATAIAISRKATGPRASADAGVAVRACEPRASGRRTSIRGGYPTAPKSKLAIYVPLTPATNVDVATTIDVFHLPDPLRASEEAVGGEQISGRAIPK